MVSTVQLQTAFKKDLDAAFSSVVLYAENEYPCIVSVISFHPNSESVLTYLGFASNVLS
jgi:hypothetical protein